MGYRRAIQDDSGVSSLFGGMAGLLSGVITLAMYLLQTPFAAELYSVGLIFGLVMCAYFAGLHGFYNPLKLGAFVMASTAAYAIAFIVAAKITEIVGAGWSARNPGSNPLAPMFAGGWLGALIVLEAAVFLFGPRDVGWQPIGKAALWSIAGGLLGIAGTLLDGEFGPTPNEPRLLYPIWQAGTGALLGLLIHRIWSTAPAVPMKARLDQANPEPRENLSVVVVGGVFLAFLLAFLGWLTSSQIRQERRADEQHAVLEDILAETPPRATLPDRAPKRPEDMLLVREIAGHPAGKAYANPYSGVSVGAALYSVRYGTEPEVGPDAVAVEVREMPNAEWAHYQSRHPLPDVEAISPESIVPVTQAGANMYKDSLARSSDGTGWLCFRWPSGNFAVSICYATPTIDQEFLKEYLEKYPSAL